MNGIPQFDPKFIGRKEAVNVFHSLRTLREQKNVLYVDADGGFGKTWLLQEYIAQCKQQRRPWHTAPEGVEPIIDFINLENRTVDGLRRSIVKRLGKDYFPNFSKADGQYQKERNKSRLAELQRDIDFWFFQEFKRALRSLRTYTALFFDTFEVVHNRRVGRWFLDEFLPNRATMGCFIVFAGRPRDLTLPLNVEAYRLLPFSTDEAMEYFQQKWHGAPGDPETQFIDVCDGKPLLLDLVVHYARRLQGPLSELIDSSSKKLDENRLVARFIQSDPISEIIQAMAHLKRRYNSKIFEAHGADEDISYEEAEEQLRKLPFVKYRSTEHALALHDEFQRMIADQQHGDWLELGDILFVDVVQKWYDKNIAETSLWDQYLLKAEQLAYILERDFQAGIQLYKEYFETIKVDHLFDLNDMIWGEVAALLNTDTESYELILEQANWLFEISRYRDAAFWFEKLAKPEFDHAGTHETYMRVRIRLGHCYLRLGDVDKAGKTWEIALSQAKKQEDITAQASFSYNLGHVRHRQGRWADALTLYTEAIQFARECRDAEIMGEASFVSARLRARQADLEKALQDLKNGLKLTESLYYGQIRHAQALAFAGDVHRYLDDPLAAQNYYGQALHHLEKMDAWFDWRAQVLAGIAAAYNRSGILRRERGNDLEGDLIDQKKSLDYFKQSLSVVREHETESSLHQIFDRMGDLFVEIAHLEQVSKDTELYEEIQDFSKMAGEVVIYEERSWKFRLRESGSSFDAFDNLGKAQRLFDLALLQADKFGEPHYMFDSLTQAAAVAQMRNRDIDLDYYSRLAGTLHGLDDRDQEKLFINYLSLLKAHNLFRESPSRATNQYALNALVVANGGVFGKYLMQQQFATINQNLLGIPKDSSQALCNQLSKSWKENPMLREFIQSVMDQLLFVN